jgi:hypothetical protein
MLAVLYPMTSRYSANPTGTGISLKPYFNLNLLESKNGLYSRENKFSMFACMKNNQEGLAGLCTHTLVTPMQISADFSKSHQSNTKVSR